MIIGIGIDQVQIERIRKVAPRLFERICTEAEREYCERFGPEGRFERYAGRFAAKEALSKALGTGIAAGVEWKDLEILPTASGAPRAVLHGKAAAYAQSLGATRIHVSITHDKVTASAIGILEGPDPV
jgi:holo-[acyl-carrier protein] synthase